MDKMTLNSLGFDTNVMDTDVHFDNPLILDLLLMNSPSEYSFAKHYDFKHLKYQQERFIKKFAEHYAVSLVKSIQSKEDLLIDKDIMYIRDGYLAPRELVNFFRNALAHRNIFYLNSKIVLFKVDAKRNSKNPKIETNWNAEINALLCVESLDRFVNIIDFYNSIKN